MYTGRQAMHRNMHRQTDSEQKCIQADRQCTEACTGRQTVNRNVYRQTGNAQKHAQADRQ